MFDFFKKILKSEIKKVLHVGCGSKEGGSRLHPKFKNWQEIRLDIDPDVKPDIINDICNMKDIDATSVDAVYSSHNLEHLFTHQVSKALQEFYRVLKFGGEVLITLPDIKQVCQQIVSGDIDDILYQSPMGPISALDILYGHITSISHGKEFMAHKTAFTAKSLEQKLLQAKFNNVQVSSDKNYNLWASAIKS